MCNVIQYVKTGALYLSSKYIPNEPGIMLQNYAYIFTQSARETNRYNEREKEKFTDMFTDFKKQLNSKKPSLFKFYVVSKTNIHEYLQRLYICVRLDFLHVLQPKQWIEIG